MPSPLLYAGMDISIEASLSRRNLIDDAHPLVKRLYAISATRPIVRAWIKETGNSRAQWASLPPVVA